MQTIYVEKNVPRILLTKLITPHWPDFVWTPLSSARVAQWEDPPLPGRRWIRVRNLQCGICASDLSLLFAHADPRIAPAALPANECFYLGHEKLGLM
jgi:threonine dehydrogenase-like Zn-dependent dehydrogenase